MPVAGELGVDRLYGAIVRGQEAERTRAQEQLPASPTERQDLRVRLLGALNREYLPQAPFEEDKSTEWTRSWILSTLGRICDDDRPTAKLLRNHLQTNTEKSDFVRFWTLEGLVAGKASDLQELATQIERETKEMPLNPRERTWLRELGVAIRAWAGYGQCLERLKKAPDADATLRALKYVYIPAMVDPLVKLLREHEPSYSQHNAIKALGRIPSGSTLAEPAARALMDFIANNRPWGFWDGMRVYAIEALANLKVEASAAIIADDLFDDNPAIVRAAARSLQAILGVPRAVSRILEAASKTGGRGMTVQERNESLGSALRWMDPAEVAETLEAALVSGAPEQQDVARDLLVEIGGPAAFRKLQARTRAIDRYTKSVADVEDRIQNLFLDSIKEARFGYRVSAGMDVVVFSLGVALLAVSAILALSKEGSLATWIGVGATGIPGVLGVLYGTLVAKPREEITEAVNHLMFLKVVFLGYLRQLHQVDQAYTRVLLEENNLKTEKIREFTTMIETTMSNAAKRMEQSPSSSAAQQ